MKKAQWLESAGFVGVVLSLLFVALQIRQANSIALVDSVSAHYASFAAVNELVISDPGLLELIVRSRSSQDVEEFTQAERVRLGVYMAMTLNTWIPANIAFDNGQLARASFDAVFDDARAVLNSAGPAMLSMWEETVSTYPGLADLEIIRFIKAEIERLQADALEPVG